MRIVAGLLIHTAPYKSVHPTRLRLGQIAARGVAWVVTVGKAQSQTRPAGELVRWAFVERDRSYHLLSQLEK